MLRRDAKTLFPDGPLGRASQAFNKEFTGKDLVLFPIS